MSHSNHPLFACCLLVYCPSYQDCRESCNSGRPFVRGDTAQKGKNPRRKKSPTQLSSGVLQWTTVGRQTRALPVNSTDQGIVWSGATSFNASASWFDCLSFNVRMLFFFFAWCLVLLIRGMDPINSACQGVIALKMFLHYVHYVLYYILTPSESSATLTHRVVLLNEWESDRSPISDIPHVGFRE